MGTATLNPLRLVFFFLHLAVSDMQGYQQSINLDTKHHIREIQRKRVHAGQNWHVVWHHCPFYPPFLFQNVCNGVYTIDPQGCEGWHVSLCWHWFVKAREQQYMLWVYICNSVVSVVLNRRVQVCLSSGQTPQVEQLCRSAHQFMSMVLKTHSVNFLSLAEAL